MNCVKSVLSNGGYSFSCHKQNLRCRQAIRRSSVPSRSHVILLDSSDSIDVAAALALALAPAPAVAVGTTNGHDEFVTASSDDDVSTYIFTGGDLAGDLGPASQKVRIRFFLIKH